jgi:hypothetical protein
MRHHETMQDMYCGKSNTKLFCSCFVNDKGKEFLAEFAKMVKNDYGLICKLITTRNLESNAVLEIIHKTVADIIRTHNLYENRTRCSISFVWCTCSSYVGY